MRPFKVLISFCSALVLLFTIPQVCRADASGADVLLESVATPAQGGAQTAAANQLGNTQEGDGFRLNDPFSMQFFADWRTQTGLSYEVNSWVMRILKGDDAGAAHLWSAIEPRLPGNFEQSADAAWLYVLWKMDLGQSFFDQWTQIAPKKGFLTSRIGIALDQVVSPGFDAWVVRHAIQISPEQQKILASLGTQSGSIARILLAWSSIRDGKAALQLLPLFASTNQLVIPLAKSAVLDLARSGDLAGAGKLMKTTLEPAIHAAGDPVELSSYDLEVARLLYQAGALKASDAFYSKIPSGTPQYLKAQEELTWVLLREGDSSRLRGQLATLALPIFRRDFAPEVPLVRAISNLKLCFYDQAEKDFQDFVTLNRSWAQKIDAALAASSPPAPAHEDVASARADREVQAREAEAGRLDQLAQQSITAVLPAVGPQGHWVKLRDQMKALAEIAKKEQNQEYRRQWTNQKLVLAEAIRKMQFVRVELMSEVHELAARTGAQDSISVSAAAPMTTSPPSPKIETQNGQIAFPFDGVLWPDELFKLRSAAQNRCLALRSAAHAEGAL